MKNFSTWMLVMFMAMFWVLRIIIAFTYEVGGSFGGIEPFNQTMEIILLFVVLLCMLLVIKRKMIGALIYLLAYGMYFGTDLMTGITTIMSSTAEITPTSMGLYLGTIVSLIGIALPLAVLFDLLLDKNEQFDRKMDDRADKNNYRTM